MDLLPYQHLAVDAAISAPRPSWAATTSPNGKLVLLVEDNEGVRRATSALLKAMGYRVIEASTGAEALAFVQAGGELDIVLSDLVMPGGVGGLELVERLEELRPDIKTLLMSGFPGSPDGHDNPLQGKRFLHKPYTPEGLRRALEEA
jgi:CheY-like chemotaxis protein